MTKNFARWFRMVALLWVALSGLPFVTGCGRAAEEPKTPEQIEESRLKHQETSRRELGQ